MIRSSGIVAILDACVLYSAPIRDLLLHLADHDLYTPRWTEKIHDEWTRNLLKNRPELSAQQLKKTVAAMQNAFPAAEVLSFESLIKSIHLPDQNDAHVVAAAIRCRANVIITANTKDFPNQYLKRFAIEAQHPDSFITHLIANNPDSSIAAFKNQVANLQNPPMSYITVLSKLENAGLVNTSKGLLRLI